METIEYIRAWMAEHPTAVNILRYLVWIVLIILVISFLRNLVKRKLPDIAIRYKSQKAIEILGYLIIILVTITYFTGSIKDVTIIIGLLTAGITITLQELILSVAGSFYIFIVKVYQPGDRIELNGIKGDVIDIDSIYTTMMEIGEWVSSDNYSGRIVKLSNSFVFKGAIYNYSQDFPFVWDEITLPIRYGGNLERAKSIVMETATDLLSEYVQQSIAKWQKVVKKYYIEDAIVAPTIAIKLTDNWVEINLRYIVDYKKRRTTRHLLSEAIGQKIRDTKGEVELASATFEVVRIPGVKLDQGEP
jgi:small-conductance mechanosensitive channel